MGGVTLAHHLQNDTYAATDTATDELMTAQNWPVDDLSDEVKDLMLREWLHPWSAMTADPDAPCIEQDSPYYAQAIQLEDLFGQSDLTFDNDASPFYDELTFVPNNVTDDSLERTACVPLHAVESMSHGQLNTLVKPVDTPLDASLRRRRSSSSSEEEDPEDNDDDTDSEDDLKTPTSMSRLGSQYAQSQADSSSEESDSEDESELMPGVTSPYAFVHKRQLEEILLAKITNELDAEKLPGILAIVSSTSESAQHSDEVEIDLSCLARDQLVRVLGYVEACILEQSGGPAVNISDFKEDCGSHVRPLPSTELVSEKPPQSRKRAKKNTTDFTTNPIPMTKRRAPSDGRKRRRRNKKRDDDDLIMSSSLVVHRDPDSIASSRPKRRAAQHRRRLLDEALRGSDQEDDDDDDNVLVVFSDEQMDLGVVDNETIVHQPTMPTPPVAVAPPEPEALSDNDEEIDIML